MASNDSSDSDSDGWIDVSSDDDNDIVINDVSDNDGDGGDDKNNVNDKETDGKDAMKIDEKSNDAVNENKTTTLATTRVFWNIYTFVHFVLI